MRISSVPTKETPTQVISFAYCEILKNTYFEEDPRTAVSNTSNFRYGSYWYGRISLEYYY